MEETTVKATDMYFGKQQCAKCARHPSECFVKDICKGFVDANTTTKSNDKFEQYDELKALTNHANEGFLGKV